MVSTQVANSKHVSAAVQNATCFGSDESSLVLQALQKRLRNNKKRLRGLDEIQAKADAGQALNSDQEKSLLERSSVVAIIDELERLHKVLQTPLEQELEAARATARAEGAAEATAAAALAAAAAKPPKPPKSPKEWEKEKKAAVTKARNEATSKAHAEFKTTLENAVKKASEEATLTALHSLIELFYCSTLLEQPYSAERNACLYNSITEDDINTLCYVGHLLTMKASTWYSSESHKDALEACKKVALRIISQPEAQVHPTLKPGTTGKSLRQTVDAIKKLDIFTVPPGQPAMPALPRGAAGDMMGPAPVVMGHAQHAQHVQHAQHAQQQSHIPAYYGMNSNTMMPSILPPVATPAPAVFPSQYQLQQPQQGELGKQQEQHLPQHSLSAIPTVPIAVVAAPLPSAPIPQVAPKVFMNNEEDISEKTLKAGTPENLMNRIFGGVGSGPGTVVAQEQQPCGPMSFFNGDSNLGIEGMSLEVDATATITTANNTEKSTAPLVAPAPAVLPTPSPTVLVASSAQGAAKKRRNYSSRGSSQSRGSGAGPLVAEAGRGGSGAGAAGAAGDLEKVNNSNGNGHSNNRRNKRGGKAKKQAIQQQGQQDKTVDQQQQQLKQHNMPQLQFQQQQQQQQQKEQRPPAPPANNNAAKGADAGVQGGPRPNSKNRNYYRHKPRTQQPQAQPQRT